jgi:hypothetical protein
MGRTVAARGVVAALKLLGGAPVPLLAGRALLVAAWAAAWAAAWRDGRRQAGGR